MSLELRAAEATAIDALWASWEGSTDGEIEATFKDVDYTRFLTVLKYLRELGLNEEPHETKLNIMTPGGLRFTLTGEKAIRTYCRDNTLKGKAFHVIKKEKKAAAGMSASEVDLRDYDVRIKLRRELALDALHPQVLEALGNWERIPKTFRYMKRFSFRSKMYGGIVFDASLVRSSKKNMRGDYIPGLTFQSADIAKQPVGYELEVEAMQGATQKALMIGVTTLLRGLQHCYVLTRKSVAKQILELLAAQTGMPMGRFPGAQPKTLKKANIALEPESEVPNLRTGDYNVTDKADGLRCLMVAARDGRIYMVDRNLHVYGTGRRLKDSDTAEWAGAILDGEWVTQNAASEPMSKYFAFDIFNGARGEDVTGRPFYIRTSGPAASRLAAMTACVAAFEASLHIVPRVPERDKLSIHMKTFRIPADPTDTTGIFKEAGAIMEGLKSGAPYHTDGLIFSPNASPLPKRGTWDQQFKWKPASMNSVDFLVLVEKERTGDGKPTSVDFISTHYNDETLQMVQCKTLRLFVGSSIHPALENPRDTILNEKPIPKPSELQADYRPVEFAPQPPDPMASICYVPINAGATDAAGAAPEAQILEALDDNIYCDSGDPIEHRTIVEMVYDPAARAGFRWKPLRVRWDKTEQFARGEIRGTLNYEDVANDVWSSIHDPITEKMISTGDVTEDVVEGVAAGATAYYQRKAPQRDLYKVRHLREFHNQYIKGMLLRRALPTKGLQFLDMSMGQGGDLNRLVDHAPSFVLGCDIAETGLTDPKSGAYSRYLNKIVRSRAPLPSMIFVQADSAQRYKDGSAGQTPMDRVMLRALWGESEPTAPPAVLRMAGAAARGFDAAALMFSLHYFFKDRSALDGMLRNLTETIKVGGLFVGCCFDGDSVAGLLRDVPLNGTKRGTENGTDIWTITKRYDNSSGIVPPTDLGLGLPIDVNFISIGETYTEYLVSFQYFQQRMAEVGFELLNDDELAEIGLYNSTNMFKESHEMAASLGFSYPMTPVVATFSFLNRWFIFRRRRSVGVVVAPVVQRPVVALDEAPAGSVSAAVAPPVTAEEERRPAIPLTLTEEDLETAAEVAADVAAEEVAIAGAAGPLLTMADGPVYTFNPKSAAAKKTELRELGLTDTDWRKYLCPNTLFMYHDLHDPAIVYPSLEAALGSARYQYASNKPELGPQTFSVSGKLYQEMKRVEDELVTEGAAGAAAAKKRALTAEEKVRLVTGFSESIKDAIKPTAMRTTGAKFSADKWTEEREHILVDYVRQRYEGDVHFKEILAALAAQKALLVYKAAGAGELGGSAKNDGTIEGDNLYGRALMRAVGFTY